VQLERWRATLAERGMVLELDECARALLAREGYDPNYGARPLRRYDSNSVQIRCGEALAR